VHGKGGGLLQRYSLSPEEQKKLVETEDKWAPKRFLALMDKPADVRKEMQPAYLDLIDSRVRAVIQIIGTKLEFKDLTQKMREVEMNRQRATQTLGARTSRVFIKN